MNKIARELLSIARELTAEVWFRDFEKSLMRAGFKKNKASDGFALIYDVRDDTGLYELRFFMGRDGYPERIKFTTIPTEGRAQTYGKDVSDWTEAQKAVASYWKKKTGKRFAGMKTADIDRSLINRWLRSWMPQFKKRMEAVPLEYRIENENLFDLIYELQKGGNSQLRKLGDALEELESDMWFEDYLDRNVPEDWDEDEDEIREIVQEELENALVKAGLMGRRAKASVKTAGRDAAELLKKSEEAVVRSLVSAKGPVQTVYEGMDAAFDIIDGMEGMVSESGDFPDQFWKPDVFYRYDKIGAAYNKAAKKGKFTTKELQELIDDVRDLLYDLIDGLEGVVSEQGEVPARYWKRGALKNGKKAYNALKRTRVAAATFTEFGLTYPNDSKYAKQMAHYLAPPDDDYERNQWNALRDWGKKSGASKQDMDKVLLAIDTGQANRILRHAVQSLRDVMEIADRLGIGR